MTDKSRDVKDPACGQSGSTALLGEFVISPRDQRLHELATKYHVECEIYDRTVCSGPIIGGLILPATLGERSLILRNATVTRERVVSIARGEGFGEQEISRAINRWDEPMPNVV